MIFSVLTAIFVFRSRLLNEDANKIVSIECSSSCQSLTGLDLVLEAEKLLVSRQAPEEAYRVARQVTKVFDLINLYYDLKLRLGVFSRSI